MAQSITYNASESIQKFTVPEGILSIHVDCIAPKGLNYSGNNGVGGPGGRVQCDMHVTPGQTLYIVAGMTSMAYNASDIRTNNAGITDANSLRSRIIVAGGGGQGGKMNSYWQGTVYYTGAAGGGTIADAGSQHGGGGGTQTAGGAGGAGGGWGYGGNAGTFGLGGNPAGSTGRGGAGWYGGGSGGFDEYWDYGHHGGGASIWGNGGGGSSYAAVYCSNVEHTKGTNTTTNGKVTISWGDPVHPIPIDIDVNAIITYDDLIGDYISWLRINCANVDGYSSSVTAALLSGYSGYIDGTTVPVRIVESTVIPVVTNATCKSQIDTYLSNCGLATGSNNIVKSADILKYYNALAAFSAAKLVTVCSQFASSTMLMYKSSATIPSITKPTNVLLTGTQVKNLSTEFMNLVNRSSKMHMITYIIG